MLLMGVMLFSSVSFIAVSASSVNKGFDEFGYNYQARIFVGTGESWAMGKFGMTHEQAEAYMGIYAHDQLVMKWSQAWDDARFHGEAWTADAWCNNEWNGMVPDGSGESEIIKIIWVGTPTDGTNPLWREDGYAIWGEFEVIMDHYVGAEGEWLAHAIPTGYGGN